MWIMVNTTVICFRVLSVIKYYYLFLAFRTIFIFGWRHGSVPCCFHLSLLIVIGLHVSI